MNCRNITLDLTVPQVMGILNLTPNSFYDGGNFLAQTDALKQIGKMAEEGAAVIDIGGMSSKPGAAIISAGEELNRILPVLKEAVSSFPDIIFSVDTVHTETAAKCIDEGASVINDISGGLFDHNMIQTAAERNAAFVIMHMRGTPETMQHLTSYNDLIAEINKYFTERIQVCSDAGLKDVILDPGFGFAKTIEQNFILLKNLKSFEQHGYPVLAGLSRKSMIYKTLGSSPVDALNGTTALNMIALQNGAKLLRVHDVKEAVETVKLFLKYDSA